MTYIPTGAGVALRPLPRTMLTKAPGTFIDGPRILVGPFNWKDDGKEHSFTLSKQRYNSREAASTRNWIRTRITEVGRKYEIPCRQFPAGILSSFCVSKHKGWRVNEIGRLRESVRLPIAVFQGKIPIARTKHKKTGRWWGIFVEFRSTSIKITWKKAPKNIFAKIWNLIKDVVSFIVETLKDLFAVLAAMACALAKTKLAQVSTMQQSKTPLTTGEIAAAKRMGLSDKQIADLAKSKKTGTIDQATAANIGNAIISNVCGVDPPMLLPSSTPWLLWGAVGVVGLVGTAVLLKKGK